MTTTRRSLFAVTGAGLTLAAIGPVAAQTYPTRLIKIVAPFPAGGPTDVVARLMADGTIHRSRPAGHGRESAGRRRRHAGREGRRRRRS